MCVCVCSHDNHHPLCVLQSPWDPAGPPFLRSHWHVVAGLCHCGTLPGLASLSRLIRIRSGVYRPWNRGMAKREWAWEWEWQRGSGPTRLVSWLVNGCFEPSEPLVIISGLKETFMKRYILERTNKAEIRPEEQSEKRECCRENLRNEIQLKGP